MILTTTVQLASETAQGHRLIKRENCLVTLKANTSNHTTLLVDLPNTNVYIHLRELQS